MFHFQIIAADWYFFKIDSLVISNLLKRKKSVTCTYLYAINVCLRMVVFNIYFVVFVYAWWCPTYILLCLFTHGGVQHLFCCVFALFIHFKIIAADWYFFKIDSLVISNLLKRKKSVTCTYLYAINVREYGRGNQKWTIQRNWQHRAHKTKINKAKTQQNIWWLHEHNMSDLTSYFSSTTVE
jgi:predicted HAD superfamily hydrolase